MPEAAATLPAMTKILIIHGHPEAGSLGSALADACATSARDAGHDVREIRLRDLEVDPVLRDRGARFADLEPCIVEARESIEWAQHLVVQYPTWWASTPALLKGFIDRVFVPGFAYRYHDKGNGWDKLLKGRSARLLVTMDAPVIFDSLYYFASSRRAMSKGVMAFSGVKPTKVSTFAPIRSSSDQKRAAWLEKAQTLGSAAS